ncbi:MAG: phage BR0599 family protein, partial [Rhodobacteraceae bacterium]|nr:phage BR0599 family protein [Paracoccaceae bacterium]
DGRREITLWNPIRAEILPGDALRLDAGFDGRFETCRLKFASAADYRGFPDIPGEDWLTSYPKTDAGNPGGSLRS